MTTLQDLLRDRAEQGRQTTIIVPGRHDDRTTTRVAREVAEHAPGDHQHWFTGRSIADDPEGAIQQVKDANPGDVLGFNLWNYTHREIARKVDAFLRHLNNSLRYKPVVLVYVIPQPPNYLRKAADLEVTPTAMGIVDRLEVNPHDLGGEPLRFRLESITVGDTTPEADSHGPPECQHPDCTDEAAAATSYTYCVDHRKTHD